ncbi:MipA/OmpV family protein [Cupriavidus sp. HPC(L)]|uniref:MipA/OmpV family protein n=1 Tax=Cupriavidus sp. HPC(L) TaxID=1217418 RepID=UPI0009FB8828|nr:MipA/OmpV family protein [Cupriavidus sp. HPC(L)]
MNETRSRRRATPIRYPAAVAAIALLASLWTPQGWAQVADAALQPGESQWGLGVGAAARRKPYRDIGTDYSVIPVLSYENRWVHVFGLTADLKLPSLGPVSFRLRTRYGLSDGYEASDSGALEGMADRNARLWFGGAAIWHNPIANVSAEWLGSADGNRATLQVSRGFQYGNFRLTPHVSAQWLSSQNVDYYYGVRASEARIGRPQYQGDSTVNFTAGLRVDYRLARHHGLFLDVSATRLGSGIKDSPIVDRSNMTTVQVGYLYRF